MRRVSPIATRWAGRWFRSRLEARWAVFYDALGLRYHHEPQGYDLGPDVGPYLPDFWIPKQSGMERGYFIEIKPEIPSRAEQARAEALAEAAEEYVYLFYLPISDPRDSSVSEDGPANPAALYTPGGLTDTSYAWTACPACGAVSIEWMGRATGKVCGHTYEWRRRLMQDEQRREYCGEPSDPYRRGGDALVRAYEASLSERFESPA